MTKNLFDIPPHTDCNLELFDPLTESGNPGGTGSFRLERILSFGQTTPEGEWYDQAWTEWVAVIRGSAVLNYEHGEPVALKAGDYLIIPPHRKHRVSFTSGDCVWLALHYDG